MYQRASRMLRIAAQRRPRDRRVKILLALRVIE
jgi:hypothetical protein